MCRLEKDPGPCPGSVLRWYYDAVRQMCSQFVYGGCKGNANRFLTRAACEQRCPVKGIRKSKKETIIKKKRKKEKKNPRKRKWSNKKDSTEKRKREDQRNKLICFLYNSVASNIQKESRFSFIDICGMV